ncbi:MAG: GntR family transcriptional regulator [Hyphomicrobiaceae bacterium]
MPTRGETKETPGQTERPTAPAVTGRRRKPAARLSQPQRAYDRLKQMILDNELQAGAYVLQEELGVMLGVSRTPIREALIRLEQEGLVEIRPRHGMRVLPISIEAMREIYEVLTALEALAARIVATKGLASHQLAAMELAVDDMEGALTANDLDAWARADQRFHALLVGYSGNSRLIDMVETVIDQSYRVRRLTLRLRPKPVASNSDHRALVEAIRARDPERAYRVHEQHRRKSGEMLVELLKKLEIKTF